MTPKKVLLYTITNLASNAPFVAPIVRQGAYRNIHLECLDSSGDPVAYGSEVSSVELVAGGESIIKPYPPAVLLADMLYDHPEYAASTGIIPINTDHPGLSNEIEQLPYSIGTYGLSDLYVRVRMGTKANVNSIRVWADQYEGVEVVKGQPLDFNTMTLGRHIRMDVVTDTATGTGLNEYDKYPHLNKVGVKLMSLMCANAAGTGVVKELKVELGNDQEQMVSVASEQNRQRMAGRRPQANYFHYDFALGNHSGSGLPLGPVEKIKSTLNWSTDPAATHYNYVKTVHGVDPKANI